MTTDRELMQQALDALEKMKAHSYLRLDYAEEAIAALRDRLAQPEQDVPATRFGNMVPVGWLESPDGVFRANPLYKIKFPSKLLSWQLTLYTAPPQRKPLTDEEIRRIELAVQGYTRQPFDVTAFARAIEAAHGIKENT